MVLFVVCSKRHRRVESQELASSQAEQILLGEGSMGLAQPLGIESGIAERFPANSHQRPQYSLAVVIQVVIETTPGRKQLVDPMPVQTHEMI